jgi:hypothetical protein
MGAHAPRTSQSSYDTAINYIPSYLAAPNK